jgi:hypothetical protein
MSDAPKTRTRQTRLNEATEVLWRSADTVQLELGDRRVVVHNVRSDQLSELLNRTPATPSRHRKRRSPSAPDTADLLRPADDEPGLRDLLAPTGLLAGEAATGSRDVLAAYLSPEFGSLSGQYGDDATTILTARRRSSVSVHGTSRIAATVASTLAAAGVGQVYLVDRGDVTAADSCPGGLSPSDEGRRFGVAGPDAIRRAAPDAQSGPPTGRRPADLVILTDPSPNEPSIRSGLHLDGITHLAVSVNGSHAVVGPLVVPGRSSCLRCADLTRTDRDPAWPALAMQLGRRANPGRASAAALCLAAAGVAVMHGLAYLDGEPSAVSGGTLEWRLPDWRLRRRSWPPHASCDCGAATPIGVRRQNDRVIPR